MYEEVAEILAKQLRIDKSAISEDSGIMENLGADSLDVVEISMAIEEKWGISVPDEDIVNFRTPGDIVRYLENKG